ncbi:MAG: cation:proton antiporter [Proteobacteria bacterium]|nr:cation:proton antiporter [Pseudomonadota bacterium]
MPTLYSAAVLLFLASLFGLLSDRFLRLPRAIGLMVVALAASLVVIIVDWLAPTALTLQSWSTYILQTQQLPAALFHGPLCFLLFAGALQADAEALWQRQITVFLLATISTLVATGLFAGGMWVIFHLVNTPLSVGWCLVLGAVLAPTDPVAVSAVLARVGLPTSLQAVMTGESLFNDGAAVVTLTASVGIAGGGDISWPHMGVGFVREMR